MTTVGAARRQARRALAGAGIETAELDARLLTGHAFGLDPSVLITADADPADPVETDRLMALVGRRLAGEPVARIVGSKEFWGFALTLSSDTLVPRPETEHLVETALAWIDATGCRDRALRFADIGTGSGAILIALLREMPAAVGIGTDISAGALDRARANAERIGVRSRAVFARADYADALAPGLDFLVANPPYIRRSELAGLAPEVRKFDPVTALDGGHDGLDGYRRILAAAPHVLRPGGAAFVEVGADQAVGVAALMTTAGLVGIEFVKDLAGHDRVVTGHRPLIE